MESRPKIYIVANNKYLTNQHFNIIRDNDIVCFCNHSQHDCNRFDKNIKFRFVKCAGSNILGYKPTFNNRYQKVFFILALVCKTITERPIIYQKFNNFKDNKKILKIPDLVNMEKYSKKKPQPTTGFVAFHKMKQKFPNKEIILLGFDGLKEPQNNFWPLHDYNYEQEFYKIHNIKNIMAL